MAVQSQEKTTVLSLAPRLQCALIAGCADFYTGGGEGGGENDLKSSAYYAPAHTDVNCRERERECSRVRKV